MGVLGDWFSVACGVGCEQFSSRKQLRGLGARAQARRISISLSFFFFGDFPVPASPAQRDEARHAEVKRFYLPLNTGKSGEGGGQVP